MDEYRKPGLLESPNPADRNNTNTSTGYGPHPVTLEDRPLFDAAFATLKQPISDSTFACTFMWAEALGTTWAEIDGHLCVFANGEDLTMLLPPIALPGAEGGRLGSVIGACFEIMDAYNAPRRGVDRSRIEYVSDEMLERVNAVRDLRLSATPLWSDYVYDTQRLIDLGGGDLKSKRHARSKFLRDFPEHRVEELAPAHVPACMALLDHWADHADETHEGETNDTHLGTDILRRKDRSATRRALEHARALGLSGLVVTVGDRLAGFTLGHAISPLQSVVLVEKTDPDFPGCPQLIFSEFCRRSLHAHPECNAGDDWGIPTLRFTKQSYRPTRLLNKHALTRQSVMQTSTNHVDTPPAPRHIVANAPAMKPLDSAPTIRRAIEADLDALVDIEVESFESPDEMFTRRQIRRLIANPRANVLVAELDGQVAGWAVGLIRQHRTGCSGRLYAIAVRRSARGRQLGRRLTVAIERGFVEAGARRAYLEVRANNDPAISLYRSLGFTPIKSMPAYYGLDLAGRGIDGIRLRKELAT